MSNAKAGVSAPYFWDFSVWSEIFGGNRSASPAAPSSSELSPPSSSALRSSANANPPSGDGSAQSQQQQSQRKESALSLSEDEAELYTVCFGDTYESIALRRGMDAFELRKANPGVAFSSPIVPGLELRVRKVASSTQQQQPPPPPRSSRNMTTAHLPPGSHYLHVEKNVSLCMGSFDRLPGKLTVSRDFLLFEPAPEAVAPLQPPGPRASPRVKMVLALDRRDIEGCAAVSRIGARLRRDGEPAHTLLQIVWHNTELGFAADQQLFFEVSAVDIAELVDAIYAAVDIKSSPTVRSSASRPTMTSGVPALRVLEDIQKSATSLSAESYIDPVEDLIQHEFDDDDFGSQQRRRQQFLKDVVLVPHESEILSHDAVQYVCASLPDRLRDCQWRLLFDFNDSGVSMHALQTAARAHRETLLLVRDMNTKQVSGVFACEPWDCSLSKTFYGTGESFVFRVNDNAVPQLVEKFPWSGANEFFQLCTASYIAVGGGGNFALCLDENFDCSSGPCPTFAGLENQALCRGATSFRTDCVELWCFEQFNTGGGVSRGRGGSVATAAPAAVAADELPRSRAAAPTTTTHEENQPRSFDAELALAVASSSSVDLGREEDDYVRLE